jgi:hypothetical protein
MGVLRTSPTSGVQYARIAPGGFEILSVLNTIAGMRQADLSITCGTDSHPNTDPHFRGEAYDLSVEGLSGQDILTLCQQLQSMLGAKFTVLYECPSTGQALAPGNGQTNPFIYINVGATGPHIHIQVRIGQTYP